MCSPSNRKGDSGQDSDDEERSFLPSQPSPSKVNHSKKIGSGRLMTYFFSMLIGFILATAFYVNYDSSQTTIGESVTYHNFHEKDSKKGRWPRITWLMTFPNSGTSYTQSMMVSVSQKLVATVYKKEGDKPVYSDSPNGPFWANRTTKLGLNDKYVLTKTHCGGRCETCGPSSYVENPHSFVTKCRSGDNQGNMRHDINLVHKTVHLIRNPFDNVVSRFHNNRKKHVKVNDTEWLNLYPKTRKGFRNFCNWLNTEFSEPNLERESRFMESTIVDSMKSVPCYDDFFRYVQWHNLAFVTTDDLDVPTHILHYENYEQNFNQTVNDLLGFLELEWIGEAFEFIEGKHYSEYFTPKERNAVKMALKELSSSKTWENIKHYFK